MINGPFSIELFSRQSGVAAHHYFHFLPLDVRSVVEILGFPVDPAGGSGAGAAAPLPPGTGAADIELFPVADWFTLRLIPLKETYF